MTAAGTARGAPADLGAVIPGATTPRPSAWGQVIAMLKVGLIGFGGGSALIPVIDDELVRRRGVLDEATFTRHTVVASITPGALPVKLGGLAGLQTSGAWLALALAVAVALPGTALTVLLVASVSAGGAALVRPVEMASVGITVFIVALLVHYIDRVLRHGSGRRSGSVVVTVLAFALTGLSATVALMGHLVGQEWSVDLPRVSAVQLIGGALLVIAARAVLRRGRGGPELDAVPRVAAGRLPAGRAALLLVAVVALVTGIVAVTLPPSALGLLGLVALSTLTSFGGGEAYVGVADGFFVGGGHVGSDVFYGQLVPIANALPGPILVKLAAAVGFAGTSAAAGAGAGAGAAWVMAAACALVAIGTCTAVAVLVLGAYGRAQSSPLVRDIGAYILPVICGLLVTTSVSMLDASADVADRAGVAPAPVVALSVVGVAVATALRHRRTLPDLAVLALCGTVSTVGLLAVAAR